MATDDVKDLVRRWNIYMTEDGRIGFDRGAPVEVLREKKAEIIRFLQDLQRKVEEFRPEYRRVEKEVDSDGWAVTVHTWEKSTISYSDGSVGWFDASAEKEVLDAFSRATGKDRFYEDELREWLRQQ